MKTIQLTQGYVALVSDKDYKRVSQFNWSVMKRPHTNYAQCKVKNTNKTNLMHRFILGVVSSKVKVDHTDFNGLNNQRRNIRLASSTDNAHNTRKARNNTSGYKGVYIDKWNRWVARISTNHKCIALGSFASAVDAAQAHDKAAIKYHGKFASTNKSLGLL